jgi:hypothetical protein
MKVIEVQKINPKDRHLVEAWVSIIRANEEIQWILAEVISVNNYFNPPQQVGVGVFPIKYEETGNSIMEFVPQDSFSLTKNVVHLCFMLLSGDDSLTGWARFQEALVIVYTPIAGLFNPN